MVGIRGKKSTTVDGQINYQLNDECRVMESMSGTPKYWQKAKYEVLSKLDNFGAFQVFFTLSCADRRWLPNFATILEERGFEINYKCTQNNDATWDYIIEARTASGPWKPILKFIQEDCGESEHELIRGNVVTATRYFHHRVKSFVSKVVMNKGNPMSVQYYSFRVEFQQRGAGHIHGILWLDLAKLEKLQEKAGKLVVLKNSSKKGPLEGLGKTFIKLREQKCLDFEDIQCLTRFVEEFFTVRTSPYLVGEDVASVARQVNQHHHTRTCRKHGTNCRFNYPKPPSAKTMITQPFHGDKDFSYEMGKILINKVLEVLENELCRK